MAKLIGRQYSVGVGKESSRGTAVASAMWVPHIDLDFEDRVKTAINEVSIARIEGSDGEEVTAKYGEVTLGSKILDQTLGYFLLSLMGTVGSVAKSAPNTAVYDHTFSVAQSTQHQSLTLALKSTNDDVAIPNAVVDSLKITADMNNYVMFEAHALGKPSASASSTVSITAQNHFTNKHVTFKNASAQSGLDGASAVTIKSFSLELACPTVLEEVLGSTPVNDVLNGQFEVSGSVTLTHNASTYRDLMLAGTYQALRFDILNTDVTIGTSSNPELKIDLHRCLINNYQRSLGLNDIVEETFDFKGHYSLTDSKMITAILTNTKASY